MSLIDGFFSYLPYYYPRRSLQLQTTPQIESNNCFPLDIIEKGDSYLINADIPPGLSKEDVKINVQSGYITISGERREERKQEDERFHKFERRFGTFRRKVKLPVDVKPELIKATMNNNVLSITFPKQETPNLYNVFIDQ